MLDVDTLRSNVIKIVRTKNNEIVRAVIDDIIFKLKSGEELIKIYDQEILALAYQIEHNDLGSEGSCDLWEHICFLQREVEKLKKDYICLYNDYLEKLTQLSRKKIHKLLNK